MGFLSFKQITLTGDLAARILRNRNRMESPCYTSPDVFHGADGAGGWPGDWEGRSLLAQILIGQAAGSMPAPLADNLAALPGQLNEESYIGTTDHSVVNEQLLSGNNWLLRALCEWYEWTGDETVLCRVRDAARGLFLPLLGKYRIYPMAKESRPQGQGEAAGETIGEVVNGWILSTDIGCAFIPLDGVTHAYHLTRDPELEPVIREMIGMFFSADPVESVFQTHATLSALRGVLRFAKDTGDDTLVALAAERFALYEAKGMTETFANQNWFGRPEWTEPCAIIDSLMVAMQLWEHTRQSHYLVLAQEIYYNALGAAQRQNGGFGCDSCPGPDGTDEVVCRIYEASWCCTMRGGEGLARAAQYTVHQDTDGVRVLFYHSGRFLAGGMAFTIDSRYPEEGDIRIEVTENPNGADLLLWLPPWAESPALSVDCVREGDFLRVAAPAAGTVLRLCFAQPAKVLPARCKEGRTVRRRGALLLCDTGDGVLRPLRDCWEQPEEQRTKAVCKVLFE